MLGRCFGCVFNITSIALWRRSTVTGRLAVAPGRAVGADSESTAHAVMTVTVRPGGHGDSGGPGPARSSPGLRLTDDHRMTYRALITLAVSDRLGAVTYAGPVTRHCLGSL